MSICGAQYAAGNFDKLQWDNEWGFGEASCSGGSGHSFDSSEQGCRERLALRSAQLGWKERQVHVPCICHAQSVAQSTG